MGQDRPHHTGKAHHNGQIAVPLIQWCLLTQEASSPHHRDAVRPYPLLPLLLPLRLQQQPQHPCPCHQTGTAGGGADGVAVAGAVER